MAGIEKRHILDMTELSEHIHSGKGAEGHQSETSNNCVPFFDEDPGQGRDHEVRLYEVLLSFPDDQACVLLIFDFRPSLHLSLSVSPAVCVVPAFDLPLLLYHGRISVHTCVDFL